MVPYVLKAHQSVVIYIVVLLVILQTKKIVAMAFQMLVKGIRYAPTGISRSIIQQLS